jgi:uncharacterized protein (TIGR02300 family)
MDKSKLGTRYTCFDCKKKFYDLNRPVAICPGCGTDQKADPTPDPRVAVMAAYKGNRMTVQQATPMKDKIQLDPDLAEDSDASTKAGSESDEEDDDSATEAANEPST